MRCDPERVTGFVDGALDAETRSLVESHVQGCEACTAQVAFERSLGPRLRMLPAVEPSPTLEGRIRQALRPRPTRLPRVLLPLAAALVLLLVGRSTAPVVAWMIVQDHENCHVVERLDTPPASLPAGAGGLVLLGASVCQLSDRGLVVHAQYGADDGPRVSVFLVDRVVLLGSGYASTFAGHAVRLSRREGQVVGLVADRAEDADAFGRAWGPPRTAHRLRIVPAALP